MKIFTTLAVLLFTVTSFSQTVCTRLVADFGTFPQGGYQVDGSATLIDSSGVLHLTLSSDFSTLAGPDLYLYLSVNDDTPTAVGNTNVEVAFMTSNVGAQSYIVPGNYSIDDFTYVLVHCKQFDHLWDGGEMATKSCMTVGIEEEIVNSQVTLFPNPVVDVLTIESTTPIEEVVIYNSLGSIMETTNEAVVNMAALPAGVYFIAVRFSSGVFLASRVLKK